MPLAVLELPCRTSVLSATPPPSQRPPRFDQSDSAGLLQGVAVYPATDGREGNGLETMFPGQGSKGLRMIMAQSIREPKRSKHWRISRVKPLAGPGATPIRSVKPESMRRCMPVQTLSLE